ncbi:MAG TPA: nucleotide exchange factor GrpE [Clostridiaceae bacterium]|nr:nucleotide exchange factor GrpE [Clostridiaceae bacterium]
MNSTGKHVKYFKVVKLLMKEEKKELNNDNTNDGNKENLEQEDQNEKQREEQEVEVLKKQLSEMTQKSEEYLDILQRTVAEFDNYKKRTQREKESIRKETVCDVVADFIKVADNLERALESTEKDCDYKTVREGIELVYKQFNEILNNLGVEEIKCIGEKFDPNLHNAVMHVNDKNYNESEVIEELQRGYIMENRVIRHSVVKVAN